MCFNVLHKYFYNFDNESDTMGSNWQEIFQMYLLKIDIETRTTLKLMNDDMKRKGLSFNGEFKDNLMRLINTR